MVTDRPQPSEPGGRGSGALLILAGGVGSRMGADGNKVFLEVDGKPILAHSLITADRSDRVHTVVLVVREGEQQQGQALLDRFVTRKPTRLTVGGSTRCRSEHHGVEAVADLIETGRITEVAVHDGARPFASRALIDLVFDTLASSPEPSGALPGLAVTEELYHLDAQQLLDPARHRWAQTPQGFHAPTLLAAHRVAAEAAFDGADTIEVVDAFGSATAGAPVPVVVLPGERDNLKVTFPEDLTTTATPEVVPPSGSPVLDLADQQTARLTVPEGAPMPSGRELAGWLHDLPSTVNELLVTRSGQSTDVGDLRRQRADAGVAAVFTPRPATQAIKELEIAAPGVAVPLRCSLDRTRVAVVGLPQLVERMALEQVLADTDPNQAADPVDWPPTRSPAALIARTDPTEIAAAGATTNP